MSLQPEVLAKKLSIDSCLALLYDSALYLQIAVLPKTVFTHLSDTPINSIRKFFKIHYSRTASPSEKLSTDSCLARQTFFYELRFYLQITILSKIILKFI